jgi:phage I-like protein
MYFLYLPATSLWLRRFAVLSLQHFVLTAPFHIALAALAFEVGGRGSSLQLLPAGVIKGKDGRPKGLPGWRTDASIASRVIARAERLANDLVIDYEHQTLNTQTNGQPAPAAGWFKQLEWREGEELFAVGVKWTERARAMIAAGEYRYISRYFAMTQARARCWRSCMRH